MNFMSKYEYKTKGTCSRKITVELEGRIIKSVEFEGGCAGNTCGARPTSCPDQLAKALQEAYAAQQA